MSQPKHQAQLFKPWEQKLVDLITFLKNRKAYHLFRHNFYKTISYYPLMYDENLPYQKTWGELFKNELLNNSSISSLINSAFYWATTPQKRNFWSLIYSQSII